jgi:hypothetical protein
MGSRTVWLEGAKAATLVAAVKANRTVVFIVVCVYVRVRVGSRLRKREKGSLPKGKGYKRRLLLF